MEIDDIVASLAEADRRGRKTPFLAPRVGGGDVETRIEGLVRTFSVEPDDFEGWGVFEPHNPSTAQLQREAQRPDIERYLELFEPLRAILVEPLERASWLAHPVNDSDMRQRFGTASPFVVHLVERARPFDSIVARSDGRAWWFERLDRRVAPRRLEALREAWRDERTPDELDASGLTPAMHAAYAMRWSASDATPTRPEQRVDEALETGGGELCDVEERNEHLRVEWRTSEGERHVSLVTRDDFTVLGAGICLSGRDRDFDLESLVGVVEQRPEWG